MGNKLLKWGKPSTGHYHTLSPYSLSFPMSTIATTCVAGNPTFMTTVTSNSAPQTVYDERPKKDCSICNPKPKEWTMKEWAEKLAEALFWYI